MPFPIDKKYIEETESELNVKFPTEFKNRMIKSNGGELLISREFEFELHPFFDKSDRKRISRTCNHIGLETKNAREWNGFPENGIAIGADDFGNKLILTHNGNRNLSDELYFWNHETRKTEKIAESINKLNIKKSSFWRKIFGILLIIISLSSCKNEHFCTINENNAGKEVYDLEEASCFIALKMNKKASELNLIREALIAEENYMNNIGLISEKPNLESDVEIDINELAEYALNKEKIELTKNELLEIYDTEIEYLKFIGVVNK